MGVVILCNRHLSKQRLKLVKVINLVSICESDAATTGVCPLWISGTDITDLWEIIQTSRRLQSSQSQDGLLSLVLHRNIETSQDREMQSHCALPLAGVVVGSIGTGLACASTFVMDCAIGAVGISIGVASSAVCISSSTGGGCFPGDAEIITPSGRVLISEIKVGDKVASGFTENDETNIDTVY